MIIPNEVFGYSMSIGVFMIAGLISQLSIKIKLELK